MKESKISERQNTVIEKESKIKKYMEGKNE
jgi:hypothetical protein